MAFLLRKLSRAKWQAEDVLPESYRELPADALTSCLRTSSNTLSVWKVNTDSWEEVTDILVALFVAGDRPDKADVVILKESDVAAIDGVHLVESEGESPVEENIRKTHRDISSLQFTSMGKVADLILEELRNEDRFKRFSKSQVMAMVRDALGREKIIKDELKEDWRKKLQLELQA